jgi:excinuclease ABC subunit C
MKKEDRNKLLDAVSTEKGVYILTNAENKTLLVGATDNVKKKISELLSNKQFFGKAFDTQISHIEVLYGDDLIKLFSQTIRLLKPSYNISLADESLYPYLKITREEFPRLLVTRKIADDEADYYGAFLTSTGVRFGLEFINRTFRLRTCQIQIDGNFPTPCTQFYVKRCIAPCVNSLCDRETYIEFVELVRLFLQNKREVLIEVLAGKIAAAAETLEFEKAGFWRDILRATNEVFAKKDWRLWLDDAVDTFEIEEKNDRVFINLVTQRGRRTLGKKVFAFENEIGLKKEEILADVIWQFYEFHSPKEVRLPFDFPTRRLLAGALNNRENRTVKFTVINEKNERKTSLQALRRAKFDFDFRQIKPPPKTEDILRELKELFGLTYELAKIEAFDVAHISGQDFTAAKSVWENGKFVTSESEFWLLDEESELKSLERAIKQRFASRVFSLPDLLLIDGGKPQLQAALNALSFLKERKFTVVGAIKPAGRHGEISHFILENSTTVKFSTKSEAMRILLCLRDEAHDLANKVHRQRREISHFYELAKILPSINEGDRRVLIQKFGSLKALSAAGAEELEKFLDKEKTEIVLRDLKKYRGSPLSNVKPLIVPIRFDDPNGEAMDLQPLNYQANKD